MNVSFIDTKDLYMFNTGQLFQAYRVFGSHQGIWNGTEGTRFAVWAPRATAVSVVGDFNEWNGLSHPMTLVEQTGVWMTFIPGLEEGTAYKYELRTQQNELLLKADPFAYHAERRPGTASIVKRLDKFTWKDEMWQSQKKKKSSYEGPMLIYEVHLGSWKIKGKEDFYTYQELAHDLINYVVEMGYTHIELLPLSEHPLDASWGYQATGYYAATSRYGSPEELMELVNRAHERGIGIILDWVPGHFCKDNHGLRLFDGSPLFEPADSRLAEKPLWGTLSFDFSKTEVQSFLISNALFWLDVFHIDGLRVDAVASMLDRNFDKPESMHTFNESGSSEYSEAVQFLKRLNETVQQYFPGALVMAEDSSNYPRVTSASDANGLGFIYKWNMGWMNDMLRYMSYPPEFRPLHHTLLNFAMMYAYSERFVLPLSHDEVVHGKLSLLDKMPGAYEQKFANLRLFLSFWIGHPGKKLLFMGGELAQFAEWKDADQLDWPLLRYDSHRNFHRFSRQLNHLYTSHPALWELDFEQEGFEWIDPDNAEQCVASFVRYGRGLTKPLVFICNFSVNAYDKYRIGVPESGVYRMLFCTDEQQYGGAGIYDYEKKIMAEEVYMHGREHSIEFALPGLSCMIFSAN